MANKKNPIKDCRVKVDTCFKWHCIGKIFGLSLEDIGLMYLISQIKDDKGKAIYGLIEEEILDLYQATEAEWMALHTAKMRNDEKYRMAFSELNGQRKITTERFYNEVARRKAYNERIKREQNNNESGEIQEDVVTSEETKTPVKEIQLPQNFELSREYELNPDAADDPFPVCDVVTAFYIESKEKNIPTEENWEDLLPVYTNEQLKEIIQKGNADGWSKHFLEYTD